MISSQHAPSYTPSGKNGILQWRTPGGLVFDQSSPKKTLELAVVAGTNMDPAGNGGIKRVYFEIVPNGGSTQYAMVRSRGIREPQMDYVSPLPGVGSAPSKFWGYGYQLDLETMDAGYLDITPRMETMGGNFSTGPTIRIYNDTDGVNRRPSQKRIYMDENIGVANAAGTITDPSRNITEALALAAAGTGGDASSQNVGGAEIICLSDVTDVGGDPGAPGFYTGKHHLRIISQGWTRWDIGDTSTLTSVMKLHGACSGGAETNITLEGFQIHGPGLHVEKTGGASAQMTLRAIRCFAFPSIRGTTGPSIDCIIDDYPILSASDSTNTYLEAFGCSIQERANGFTGYDKLSDCEVKGVPGIAVSTSKATFSLSDIYIHESPGTDPQLLQGATDLTRGTEFEITVPVAGTMRIRDKSGVNELADQLSPLVDNPYWRLEVTGSNEGTNNGDFNVTAVGYDSSGRSYVEVSNGGAVEELSMSSLGRLRTTRTSDGLTPAEIITQTVGVQIGANITDGAISGVSMRACNGYSLDLNGFTCTGLMMEFFVDGSPGIDSELILDLDSGIFNHLLMLHCSFSTEQIELNPGAAWTGSSIVDCSFGVGPADFPSGWVLGCHFETGSTYGVGATSGDFFSNPPTDLSPVITQQRTALGGVPLDPFWNYRGARAAVADWVLR